MKIVFVSIDALRPAYLGAYGNEWVETPTFDDWAARGVVFDQHFVDVLNADLFERVIALGVEPQRITIGRSSAANARKTLRELKVLRSTKSSADCVLWIDVQSLLPPWNVAAPPSDPWREPLPDAIAEVQIQTQQFDSQ